FHCQQAAEKALKAFLTWHDRPFGMVHNLNELGQSCIEIDSTLAKPLGRRAVLNKYASRFRYPGTAYDLTLEQATSAVELAREIVSAIVQRLPADVQP